MVLNDHLAAAEINVRNGGRPAGPNRSPPRKSQNGQRRYAARQITERVHLRKTPRQKSKPVTRGVRMLIKAHACKGAQKERQKRKKVKGTTTPHDRSGDGGKRLPAETGNRLIP